MSVNFDIINATNAAWGELMDIVRDEPYIYLDNITFWFNKENDITLIKPVEIFNERKYLTKF